MSAEMQPISQPDLIHFSEKRAPQTRTPIDAPISEDSTNIVSIRKTADTSHTFYQEKPREVVNDAMRQKALEVKYQRLIRESGRTLTDYDAYFDQLYYQLVREEYKGEEYVLKCAQIREGRIANMITFLGERLHVGISSYEGVIRNGEIMPVGWHKSLLTMMKEGVAYRKAGNVSEEDQEREQAEVDGMEKRVQPVMHEAKTGTMVVSISPPSGSYIHNFYDIFLRTEEGVRVMRFTGALALAEYQDRTKMFYQDQGEDVPTSQANFLKRPFTIPTESTYNTPEKLHAFLHENHPYLSQEQFNAVVGKARPLMEAYMNYLEHEELTQQKTEENKNAVLNKADEAAGIRSFGTAPSSRENSNVASSSEMQFYGGVAAREVNTPCKPGGMGGGAWSVGEFGGASENMSTTVTVMVRRYEKKTMTFGELKQQYPLHDKYEERYFKCTKCGVYNVRPEGTLLETCMGCNASARCETGELAA